MSHSRDLLQHIAQLRDIRNILNSMKNLAFIETRKLDRFLGAQRQVVGNMEAIAADFFAFYPQPPAVPGAQLLVVLGSERGFCGDFNERLLDAVKAAHTGQGGHALLPPLGVGNKLCGRLQRIYPQASALPGADVAEEVPTVLVRLVEALGEQQARHPNLAVTVLHHDAQGVVSTVLLPPLQHCQTLAQPGGFPPLLNLPAAALLQELLGQYLFAALHALFYTSLMAENHRRLQHMQGALRHLDKRTESLKRRYNTLRQEEITEEIEVILMTAESVGQAI